MSRLGIIAVSLLLSAAPSLSDNITIEGVARTISLFAAIEGACGDFYEIDAEQSSKIRTALTNTGFKTFGANKFGPSLLKEMDRRLQEVKITGPKQWCTYQRANDKQVGESGVFKSEQSSSKQSGTGSQAATYHYVANTLPPDAFLALRTHPTPRDDVRIKEMPNGTLLQVLTRREDGWWHVRIVPSGTEGWAFGGKGKQLWIECCTTFDAENDAVAVTLAELNQRFEPHPIVVSTVEAERKRFISQLNCQSFDYWLKQLDGGKGIEVTVGCIFSRSGERGESSVTLKYAPDASGALSLVKKEYAG